MQFKPMAVKQQGFTIIELVVVILLLGILAATALPRFIDVTTEAHDSVFEATSGGIATGVALYRAEWTARGQPAANSVLQSYGGLRAAPGYSEGDYVENTALLASSFTSPTNYTGRSSGFPLATTSNINKATAGGFTAMSSANCIEVFENVLQVGAPTIARLADSAGAAITTAQDLTAIDAETESELETFRDLVGTSATASPADFTAILATIEIDTGFENLDENDAPVPASGEPANFVDDVPACVYAYSGEAENFDRFIMYVPWLGRVESFTSAADLIVAAQYDGALVP